MKIRYSTLTDDKVQYKLTIVQEDGWIGYSVCNPKDTFVKKQGREIAIKRMEELKKDNNKMLYCKMPLNEYVQNFVLNTLHVNYLLPFKFYNKKDIEIKRGLK